ncbi:MAG: hypothetical protein Q8J74_11245, partial [Candidatus Didemnitutus sp.]|nr:hypothetical protein [Candidatus Didemnitutus sp.]
MSLSSRRFALALLGLSLLCLFALAQSKAYFPPAGSWEERQPAEVGMDAARLQQAVDFSLQHENPAPRDVALDLQQSFGATEPLWKLFGPTQPRGGVSGIVIRRGYVVAQWGEPGRVDMTHSITKTFLTTVAGLAWQQGLIRDLNASPKDHFPTPELF